MACDCGVKPQGQIVEQTFWDAGEHFDGSAEDASKVSASP